MPSVGEKLKISGFNQKGVGGPKKDLIFNPQAPYAQKIADEVVFRHFQGEGVEFFLNGPH